MPNYDLDRVGDAQFEQLCQALLKKVIAAGTITFGMGPDGGREATFAGRAPYPSVAEQWDGHWLFQVKHHDCRAIGHDKARRLLITDLRNELRKVSSRHIDNYILITNVALTSVPGSGTHDRIAEEVIPEFAQTIRNIHVWGYDDVCRMLDDHPGIRQSYLHLVTPGDLIYALIHQLSGERSALAEALHLYVRVSFDSEQYAQLDQAGELNERPTLLRRVFIDLQVSPRSERDVAALASQELPAHRLRRGHPGGLSAVQTLVADNLRRAVLIGGPGQGKSTLGQYIGQIHRAYILNRAGELVDGDKFVPSTIRVPFRLILKDYAQWITDTSGAHHVEGYLATLIEDRAARPVSPAQVHEILKTNPVVLILDGLDEVTDRSLRSRLLKLLSEFLIRCEDVLKADLQVIATSRPTGYSDQFDPTRFLHLTLSEMDKNKVVEYTDRWISAKTLDQSKATLLRAVLADCVKDEHFSKLMTTPLQVTIFILIILSGGTPPRQREELFNEYLEVIYKREKSKSQTLIQTEKRLLFGLHQFLGYLLHRRAEGTSDVRARMGEAEFVLEVFRYLRHEDPYSPEASLRERAGQMVTEAHDRLVLIVGLEPGILGFELRSIQEFFAAGYMTDRAQDARQRFARFRSIALSPHWHNVALFMAGRVGRCFPGEAAQILEVCRAIDRDLPDRHLRRGSRLALEVAADRAFGPDKILQRSAIEYALSVFDSDLADDRWAEVVHQIQQLPREDLDLHVVPLAEDRCRRLLLPDAWSLLRFIHWHSRKNQFAQDILRTSLRRRRITSDAFVTYSLSLRLDPAWIAKYVRRWATRTQQLLKELSQVMHSDPDYAMRALRTFRLSIDTARALLHAWLERWPGVAHPDPSLLERVCEDQYDELGLAGHIATVAAGASSDRRVYPSSEPGPRVDLSEPTEKKLMGLLEQPNLSIEIQAAAFAALGAAAVRPPGWGRVAPAMDRFVERLSPLEAEVVDRFALHTRAPSIDMLHDAPRMVRSVRTASMRHHVLGPPDIGAFIFDAASRADTERYWPVRNRAHRRIDPVVLRFLIRTGGVGLRPMATPLSVVTGGLRYATDILLRDQAQAWRAWAVLGRLSMFPWQDRLILAGRSREVKAALVRLCDVISNPKHTIILRGELVGLAMRAVGLRLRDEAQRLFTKISEAIQADAYLHINVWLPCWLDEESLDVLAAWESVRESDQAETGFVRAFSLLVPRHMDEWRWQRQRLDHQQRRYHMIRIAKRRLAKMISSRNATLSCGSIAISTYSDVFGPRDAARLLRLTKESPSDEAALTRLIVRRVVTGLKSEDSRTFLEGILDQRSEFAGPARVAAFHEYQQMTMSLKSSLAEMELGLPFQREFLSR